MTELLEHHLALAVAPTTDAPFAIEGVEEILDRDECLDLLRTATIGRLCISRGALPAMVPMNFRLVDDRIVFRVARGSRLDEAVDGRVVAFEAGEARPGEGDGWSVSVTGTAQTISDPADIAILDEAGIARWTQWGTDHYVVVPTNLISGRRLVVHAAGPVDGEGLDSPDRRRRKQP